MPEKCLAKWDVSVVALRKSGVVYAGLSLASAHLRFSG
jgi:hypothetical protein